MALGSLNEFIAENPGIHMPEIAKAYGEALAAYRREIAQEKGLSPEELHRLGHSVAALVIETPQLA